MIFTKTNKLDQQLSLILEKLNSYLQKTYKNRLAQVILFGSQARGDATQDSDIDILIILKDNFNDYQETQKISFFLTHLCLEYDVVITCFFTTLEQFNTKNNAFFRNIRKEGIVLWWKNKKS